MSDPSFNSVATLAVKPETGDLAAALESLAAAFVDAGARAGTPEPLGPGAADLPAHGLPPARLRSLAARALSGLAADFAVLPAAGRRKRLLIADMDSTMIEVECIDELADMAGVGDRVAAVTEAAMRGEIDFAQALERRVALLAGLDGETLARCLRERVRITPGAATLVATMTAAGALAVLVSGGFTAFAGPVAHGLGFTHVRANRLEMRAGRLTGRVLPPVLDAAAKRATLLEIMATYGLGATDTLAIGDGANDIPMLEAAGLAVTWRGKPKAEAAADVALRHTDLRTVLYLQGYRQEEFRDGACEPLKSI